MKKAALVAIAVVALLGALATASQIGFTFEEKSHWSYVAKTGDTDSRSEAALAHIKGARRYGLLVAFELAFCSAIFGALLAIQGTAWIRGKNSAS